MTTLGLVIKKVRGEGEDGLNFFSWRKSSNLSITSIVKIKNIAKIENIVKMKKKNPFLFIFPVSRTGHKEARKAVQSGGHSISGFSY